MVSLKREIDYQAIMESTSHRTPVAQARRVVVKLGTRAVSDDAGALDIERLDQLISTLSELHHSGVEVLLVSSGAVGLGAHQLGLALPVRTLVNRQAAAAVGQSELMAMYAERFATQNVTVAQVLVATGDFDNRSRYLNIRNTLLRLLRHKVVPIINENDAVSVAELKYFDTTSPVFGDNDRLSAIVASKMDADLLVMLTDVSGLFDKNPTEYRDANCLHTIDGDWSGFETSEHKSTVSRGGMKTKIEAAQIAVRSGCQAVIASGIDVEALPRVLAGEIEGTWCVAEAGLTAHRRWVAWGTPVRGQLNLDDGAIEALRGGRVSLLAAGVTEVAGDFERGAVVELNNSMGEVIGRGMISCDSQSAREWVGGKAPVDARNHDALIHREHLVLRTK